MEAFTLGVLTASFDNVIVLQALYVLHHFSLVRFINYLQPDHLRGLPWFDTLHTSIKGRCFSFNQSTIISNDCLQYDFSGLGPWLFGALMALGTLLITPRA